MIWNGRCPACEVSAGDLHAMGCMFEACALCGYQLNTCRCGSVLEEGYDVEVAVLGGRLPWAGDFHGFAEARALGLFCIWELRPEGSLWVPCGDVPGSKPDLRALAKRTQWDKTQRTFVLRPGELPEPPKPPTVEEQLREENRRLREELRRASEK